jgi:hypothetical protein
MGAQHSPRRAVLAAADQTFQLEPDLPHFFRQFPDLVK